ncbi:MAG: CHAD domain-containing protein [Bacteroidota bacterium]|nr:CHAD domain-containing protein [Bacteroidota bacterium]
MSYLIFSPAIDQKKVKRASNAHYKNLKALFNKIGDNPEGETLHQFRVEYKKLRAFLRMLSKNEAGLKIKVSKKLKKVYTISGSIRDLQLQQERIAEASKTPIKKPRAYLTLLKKEIEKLQAELSEMIREKPVNESKKKTDSHLPDEFTLTSFKNFIQEKRSGIEAIVLSGYFSDDRIHSIRKKLKDLVYNMKEYKDAAADMVSAGIWAQKDETYFKQLLEELGSFQDKCTAIDLLKSHGLSGLNSNNQQQLLQIKNRWMREKNMMKKSLMAKLKTDFTSR